jgi:glutamine synthetase
VLEAESQKDGILLRGSPRGRAWEARTVTEMAKTIIFSVAIRYQGKLALTCANVKAIGYVFDTDTLNKVTML